MQAWTGRIGKVSKTCYLLPCRQTHVEMEGHRQKAHESLDRENWKGLKTCYPAHLDGGGTLRILSLLLI